MVTRVWGKADSFELVFSPSGDLWVAAVPVDLEDGQYAVELYCIDDSGNTAYWTGVLYLNNSAAVKVRIVADKFKLWFEVDDMDIRVEPELEPILEPDAQAALQSDLQVSLEEELIKLTCTICRG